MKSAHIAAAIVVAGTIAMGVTPAWAYQYAISDFKVVRNGSTYFEDTFRDGNPPPSAPNDPNGSTNSYGGRGSFGPESGNKLTIDSSGLTISQNPGQLVQKAVFKTDTSSDQSKGLKSTQTFSVTALFDLVVPQTNAEWYFVELQDSTSTIEGTESVKVGVRRVSTTSAAVMFRRKNNVTLEVTTIDQKALDPNHSQIQLVLTKASANSNVISGSFSYVDNGVVGTPTTFANTTTIFNTNPFARAAFGASTPVASGVAQGPSTSLTLSGNLNVAQEVRNQQGNIYAAAMTGGLIFFNNGNSWIQYVGGAFPVYKTGILASQTVPILSGLNVSPYGDLALYLGYGTSDADLLSNQSYSQIYCATTAVCLPPTD
jgi:hypothetical protein